jgi:Probable transposase.
MIPIWKKEKPELKTVHSHTLQDVTMRVDLAFQAFFRRIKAGENPGYPDSKVKASMTVLLIYNQDSLRMATN